MDIARHLLNSMNPDTVAKIRAKQAAALVLTKQAELIKNMVEEGLLTTQHAEEFLEDISRCIGKLPGVVVFSLSLGMGFILIFIYFQWVFNAF